ncbi:MAG: hypothetical protein P1U63_11600 [Coxiellaceae bacterium]|nr:hypothetical protein [Coxiellaceae bacterium]
MNISRPHKAKLAFLISISIVVSLLAIFVNVGFLWVNYHYPSGRFSTLVYFVLNALVTLVLFLWAWFVIPVGFRNQQRSLFILGWLLASLIPIFGVLLLCVGAILLQWYRESDPEESIHDVNVMEFIQEKAYSDTFFSEGGAWMRLQNDSGSTEDRIKSLSALNIQKGKFANYVNRLMVQENNDELRLYAFSLLDKQENHINTWISYFTKLLDEDKKSRVHLNAVRQLASLYWEMYYLNLSQDNIKLYMLNQSQHYANKGIELDPDDGALWVLLAKIALEKNDHNKARMSLFQALTIGVPIRQVAPFMAEMDFLDKNYMAVAEHLTQDKSLRFMLVLAPVVKFWGQHG